jgi:alanine racemase
MTFSPETIRAWVDVDLAALLANARTVAAVSGSRLLPMVKANGYGLGAAEIANALKSLAPWGFGGASTEEGAALRDAGITGPILILAPLVPATIQAYLEHDLRPSVGDLSGLEAWIARTDRPFHLEIDTGMSRAGVRWDDREAIARLCTLLGNADGWEAAFTHFLAAESDPAITQCQWERFQDVLRTLPRRPSLIHAANSAAALHGRAFAGDLVRPGIFLYGGVAYGPAPLPVAALRARVVAVRAIAAGDTVGYDAAWRAQQPTHVATLSLGYADGFPRSGTARTREVELNGRLAPLLGRVTMDMCMVGVEHGAAVGDIATIYGGLVSLDRQAEASGTISYELLTRLGPRVTRRYSGGV